MIILPVKMTEAKEQNQNFFIELYVLNLPTGIVRFAACDEDITFNGEIYKPIPVQRGEIKTTVDAKVDNVELKIANVDQSFTIALYGGLDFRGSEVVMLQILYPESLSDASIYKPIFWGYLDAPVFDGKEFKVTIKSNFPTQQFPPRKCQLSCNAWFGDPDDCGAIKHTKDFTIGANSTQTLIYSASITETANYWKDGLATYQNETREIIDSGVGYIKFRYPFTYTVAVGAEITMEQGCNKMATTCANRFNNEMNSSYFKAVPLELIIKS